MYIMTVVAIETMTVTSDGSAIEARIRSLKQQLRQRQKEEKRVRNEKNRKRKAMLKQHERQLEKKTRGMYHIGLLLEPCKPGYRK